MDRNNENTLAIHLDMYTTDGPHHSSQKRSESSYRNHKSDNNDKLHQQIAMWLPLLL